MEKIWDTIQYMFKVKIKKDDVLWELSVAWNMSNPKLKKIAG